MNYKETLNLPKTSFPMRANLPKMEPEMLKMWDDMNIYQIQRKHFASKPLWILHDGPPYANGHIHMGHALNKILKDFVVKSRTMFGFNSAYVPGWDCHGLPIEHQVDKTLGVDKSGVDPVKKRQLCREFALKFIDIQREEFKRLGVFGDWNNPYLTMDPGYQATIIKEFGRFVGKGIVYKGLKPVHWCASCQTALAEAEVEYGDHESPSVYVKFPLKTFPEEFTPFLNGKKAYVIIWTTTPWTLPANLGLAFHPDFDYVMVDIKGEIFILAKELMEVLFAKAGIKEYKILHAFKGKTLEGYTALHPFIDRESRILIADFVTMDQGTGIVHIAPGHGEEDYELGIKKGLKIYNPVDDRGKFIKDLEFFGGMDVFKANQAIIEKMRKDGSLILTEKFVHSYPHCWRCKNPTIFRATEQWFIAMDKNGLRERSLESIKKVEWIPGWGEERIYNMIANRPDWCISRQRAWGVPITVFYCKSCGNLLLDEDIIFYVAQLVSKESADIWFSRPAEGLLPPGTKCPKCQSSSFEKEMDILDVWFDSGCSHVVVLEKREGLRWPSDMYLEGSDQHRGWFHSSLLESIGTRDAAPYRSVLTHGFVVDGEGRKMSKSLGNVIAPQEIIEKYGAEILRLWVAAEDYRDDIRLSEEILTRLAEAYRRIRNTARFILGNLYDFTTSDRVNYNELEEIDRWILIRLQRLIAKLTKAYEDYEFHVVFHSLHNFCAVDLSALYLDILKDRLYISNPESKARRAAQTTLFEILNSMLRLMAPVLPFTAEEVWSYLKKVGLVNEISIHLSLFPEVNATYLDDELEKDWEKLLDIRKDVSRVLEASRQAGMIGNSLEAKVELFISESLHAFLKDKEKDLPTLFIVSAVNLHVMGESLPEGIYSSETIEGLSCRVVRAEGQKCERCWVWSPTIGIHEAHPTICSRCVDALVS